MAQSDKLFTDELFKMDGEVGIFDPQLHQALENFDPTMADAYADACLLEEIYWRYAHCTYYSQKERDQYREKYGAVAQLRAKYQYLGNKLVR